MVSLLLFLLDTNDQDTHLHISFSVGRETYFTSNTLKSAKQFMNTLEDQICERGAPNRLISDCAQVEQHQNYAEI